MLIEDLDKKGSDLVGEYSFRRGICLQSRDDELGEGYFWCCDGLIDWESKERVIVLMIQEVAIRLGYI